MWFYQSGAHEMASSCRAGYRSICQAWYKPCGWCERGAVAAAVMGTRGLSALIFSLVGRAQLGQSRFALFKPSTRAFACSRSTVKLEPDNVTSFVCVFFCASKLVPPADCAATTPSERSVRSYLLRPQNVVFEARYGSQSSVAQHRSA